VLSDEWRAYRRRPTTGRPTIEKLHASSTPLSTGMAPRKNSEEYLRRRAKELAESGRFERWQAIEFELRFIEGLPEARVSEPIRRELDILCRQAKSRRLPPPTSEKAPKRPSEDKYHYHVVVTRRDVASWEWEIYSNSEPLPVPMRDGPYKSVRTAESVGSLALREFLQALYREQSLAVNPRLHGRPPAPAPAMGRARQQAAMVARTIKKLQASGVTTLRDIAAELNKQDIPTPSGTGQWQPEQVRRVLARI
jgi:hypothetical protein